jgi:hypothetical protein
MTQLRWLVTTYPEPSIATVKEYQNTYACGMVAARRILKKLQYLNDNQEWVDVPTVTNQQEK